MKSSPGRLEVFGGRLEGIQVRKDLAPGLPPIRADGELLRRVIVNLIDNAAESMEGSAVKELVLRTRFNSDRETVEIIVADSGHGISPEDKDRLFLPHFSTKDRGTGLGLAIASRIMAEHHGSIRVEDNFPIGAQIHPATSHGRGCIAACLADESRKPILSCQIPFSLWTTNKASGRLFPPFSRRRDTNPQQSPRAKNASRCSISARLTWCCSTCGSMESTDCETLERIRKNGMDPDGRHDFRARQH